MSQNNFVNQLIVLHSLVMDRRRFGGDEMHHGITFFALLPNGINDFPG